MELTIEHGHWRIMLGSRVRAAGSPGAEGRYFYNVDGGTVAVAEGLEESVAASIERLAIDIAVDALETAHVYD